MNEESNLTNSPVSMGHPLLWLVCGLSPIWLALACYNSVNLRMAWLVWSVVSSLLGGIGMVGRVKNGVLRVLLGVLLAGFFLALNTCIVLSFLVYVGCSSDRGI